MNILNILEKMSSTSMEGNAAQTRRDAFFNLGKWGKTVAIATMPAVVLSVLPKTTKANVASTATVVDVLNFALTLEYLEREFYDMGKTSGVIAGADAAIFNQILQHEKAHVDFLVDTIGALGGTPVTKPTFDFTANGAFTPFTVYAQFLALAQAFEDTGVRAYKGQAGNLMGNDAVLTAALQIHSVEARHAAEVRRLRDKNSLDAGNKGWITGNSRGTLPAAAQGVYDGEDNVMQGGVDVTTITDAGTTAIQEGFDEPLSDTQVLAIAGLFIS